MQNLQGTVQWHDVTASLCQPFTLVKGKGTLWRSTGWHKLHGSASPLGSCVPVGRQSQGTTSLLVPRCCFLKSQAGLGEVC